MCWQRNTEWKQFSIVSKDDLVKLGINAQDNSIGLIISHSCDIANTNLQAEPTLELLIGPLLIKNVMVLFQMEKIIGLYTYN